VDCDLAFTLKLWYSKVLPDLVEGSDTATSEVPIQYHDLMCLEAAKRGFGSTNADMPKDLKDLLDQGLQEMVVQIEQRQRQTPGYINVVEPE
jgi:hypothetical protein